MDARSWSGFAGMFRWPNGIPVDDTSASPRYVCFFCTDRDPGTGRQGSIVQVTGKGKK